MTPLGAIRRAVVRYFERLSVPVHVAAWVDGLIFYHNSCTVYAPDMLAGARPAPSTTGGHLRVSVSGGRGLAG